MSFLSCDTTGGNVATWTDLRIAPVFTIWVTGTLSAAFPILAYRSSVTRVRIPRTLFEYALSAWYHFLLSTFDTGSPNISVPVSLSPQHLSTSSAPPSANSPHRVLELHGILMCALYSTAFFILILICSRNVALPAVAYFPNLLHDLCFWHPCFPHWQSQVHEAWYSLW
jgi:hypothetical protein